MKTILKTIFYIFIGLLLLFLVPYLIARMMNISYFSWIKISNDWIGFWGSYFGGILTLIGVFLTIQYSKNEGNKKQKLLIRPYLSITMTENVLDMPNYLGLAGNIDEVERGECYLYIAELNIHAIMRNVGLGTAVQLVIRDMQLLDKTYTTTTNTLQTLAVGEVASISIELLSQGIEEEYYPQNIVDKQLFQSDNRGYRSVFFKFACEYEDLLGNKLQQNVILVSGKIHDFPADTEVLRWYLYSVSKPREVR